MWCAKKVAELLKSTRKKILILILTAAPILGAIVFFGALLYQNESEKIDILSGIATAGQKWETHSFEGQYEVVTFVRGEKKSPLRGPINGVITNTAKKADGSLIYDVVYEFDDFGRRKTGHEKNKNSKSKFAIFFGCSDMLGPGLSDYQTVPAIFEKIDPSYRAYNYAFPGTGLHYVNRILETENIIDELQEKEGVVAYMITQGHYPKTLGRLGHLIRPAMPQYTLQNGMLKHKGSWYENSPVTSIYKKLFGASMYAVYVGGEKLSESEAYTTDDEKLVCELLKNIDKLVKQKLGGAQFIAILPPHITELERTRLLACSVENKIEYVNISPDLFNEESITDPVYDHPSAALNSLVAQHLKEYLEK